MFVSLLVAGKGDSKRRMQSRAETSRDCGRRENLASALQGSVSALPGLTAILAQDTLVSDAEPPVLPEFISVIFHHLVVYRTASLGSVSFIYRYKMGCET